MLRYQPWTFETRAFHGLTSLTHLHLEGNQPDLPDDFTYPDQALSHVPTLEYLWLDGYPRSLGPGFSFLSNLSYISFMSGDESFYSFQSSLPEDFLTNLPSLRLLHLKMVACSISFIPPSFFDPVKNIYSLDLTSNRGLSIEGFKNASRGLQNSILNITRIVERISSVCMILNSKTFQYLKTTKLKTLIVELNRLVYVYPGAFLDLPKSIEYISVRRNNILQAFFLLALNQLPNLKTLVISHQLIYKYDKKKNSYRKINSCRNCLGCRRTESKYEQTGHTKSLHKYKNIARKEIYPHFLTTVSSSLTAAQTEIFHEKYTESVEFCGDNEYSDFVWPLPPNLTQVYASDIKLHSDIPIIRLSTKNVVKVVDFSENSVTCFGGPIYGLTSLQTVDLSRNQCYRLNPYFFTQTPNLTTLLLSMNRLGDPLSNDTEGVIFSKLDHLKTLDLSSNYLKHISEFAFKNNETLQVLNLSNNAFNTFLAILTFNRKLLILDLSNNLLTALSESTCNQLFEIKTINQKFIVNISGNNGFLCNCDTLHFLNFLLDRPEIFEGVVSFRCQLENGSYVSYAGLAQVIEELELHCIVQSIFAGVLLAFFPVVRMSVRLWSVSL